MHANKHAQAAGFKVVYVYETKLQRQKRSRRRQSRSIIIKAEKRSNARNTVSTSMHYIIMYTHCTTMHAYEAEEALSSYGVTEVLVHHYKHITWRCTYQGLFNIKLITEIRALRLEEHVGMIENIRKRVLLCRVSASLNPPHCQYHHSPSGKVQSTAPSAKNADSTNSDERETRSHCHKLHWNGAAGLCKVCVSVLVSHSGVNRTDIPGGTDHVGTTWSSEWPPDPRKAGENESTGNRTNAR